MFEALFEGPIACTRQRESPLPEERRHFLSHLQALGTRAPRSGPLRTIVTFCVTHCHSAGSGSI